MQITTSRGEYAEKIVRDANGRLVRLSFCVYEEGGHAKARLLNAVYLEEKVETKGVISLPGFVEKKCLETCTIFKSDFISPYFNSDLLYSLGSKPRAPTA